MSLWTKTSALEFLRQGTWFSKQPEWFQSFFITHSEITSLLTGEMVFKTGDAPPGVYAVLSGQVDLNYHPDETTGPVFCALAEPGAWIGVHSSFEKAPCDMDAVVVCDSSLLYFPFKAFEALNEENPLAYKAWGLHISASYRANREYYVQAKTFEARRRVACALVDLLRRVGRSSNGPEIILHVRMNQSEFASLVGVTRQYVSRFIRDLRSEGVLLWRGELIAIKNPIRLFELAGIPQPKPFYRSRAS